MTNRVASDVSIATQRSMDRLTAGGSDQDPLVREECPMCCKFGNLFSCDTCIGRGDFEHSYTGFDYKQRFSEIQTKYSNVVRMSNLLKNDRKKPVAEMHSSTLMKVGVTIVEEKIKMLKFAISDKNKLLTEKKSQIKKLQVEMDDCKSMIDRIGVCLVKAKDFTKCREIVLDEKTNELSTIRPKLKDIIRTHINELVTFIFALNEVHTTIFQNKELDINSSLTHVLAEATKHIYVSGKWVNSCEERSSQTVLVYRIVAPTLPANGNYAAYNEWVLTNKNRNYESHQTFVVPNPALTISAGLMLTSQLVRSISSFLDVFLLRNPNFSEFVGSELNETKFSKSVIYLNANVLYLCFTQNVDPKLLHPDKTIENLLHLLDTTVSDLGRVEPPDIDDMLYTSYEQKIASQLLAFNNDSDSGGENYLEWDVVPKVEHRVDCTQLSSQSTNSDAGAGIMSNTVAKISSIWTEWTK